MQPAASKGGSVGAFLSFHTSYIQTCCSSSREEAQPLALLTRYYTVAVLHLFGDFQCNGLSKMAADP